MKASINVSNWNSYRCVYLVTQWKDGCVYKTKFVKYIKVEDEHLYKEKDYIVTPLSTSDIGKTIHLL